jgi:hypothetical protein
MPRPSELVEILVADCLTTYPPEGTVIPGGFVRDDGIIVREWRSKGTTIRAVIDPGPPPTLTSLGPA